MDEDNERFAARAGSMKESRSVAAKHPGFKEAFLKIQWLLLKSLWLSSFKITAQGKGFQGFLQMKKWKGVGILSSKWILKSLHL